MIEDHIEHTAQQSVPDNDTLHCYHCGTELTPDVERCSNCGRRQHRICYCGNRVAVTATSCPECGADWSGSMRVRRKSQRTRRVKPAAVLRSALIGAGVALGLMVVANIIIKYLARIGGDGSLPPSDIGQQLDLAAAGVRRIANTWSVSIRTQAGTLGGVALGLLIGAGIGVTGYLMSVGVLRISATKTSSKRRRRSSRTSDA